jgi:hypothetical protein
MQGLPDRGPNTSRRCRRRLSAPHQTASAAVVRDSTFCDQRGRSAGQCRFRCDQHGVPWKLGESTGLEPNSVASRIQIATPTLARSGIKSEYASSRKRPRGAYFPAGSMLFDAELMTVGVKPRRPVGNRLRAPSCGEVHVVGGVTLVVHQPLAQIRHQIVPRLPPYRAPTCPGRFTPHARRGPPR